MYSYNSTVTLNGKIFYKQIGSNCLFASFLMSIQTTEAAYWNQLISSGVDKKREDLSNKYPDWVKSNCFFAQFRGPEEGWKTSDILRSLKASGRKFKWNSLKVKEADFTNPKSLLDKNGSTTLLLDIQQSQTLNN